MQKGIEGSLKHEQEKNHRGMITQTERYALMNSIEEKARTMDELR